MATNQTLLKSARLFHLYSGVFLAPALLFFAFTGGVQTFSLHETTRGSAYKPPAILVELGQLHKKQTLIVPVRNAPPAEAKPGAPGAGAGDHSADKTTGQKHDRDADRDADRTPPVGSGAAKSPVAPSAPAPSSPPKPAKVHNLLPMKIFFVIVAIGLFCSTLTGLYMAYKFARRKNTITLTLLAGIAIPLLLLLSS